MEIWPRFSRRDLIETMSSRSAECTLSLLEEEEEEEASRLAMVAQQPFRTIYHSRSVDKSQGMPQEPSWFWKFCIESSDERRFSFSP